MDWLPIAILGAVILFFLIRMLPPRGVKSISADELQEILKDPKGKQLIDVRDPNEYKTGHIQGARNIPLTQIASAANGIPKDKETYLICATGLRSAQATRILKKKGFTNLNNVAGGLKNWKGKIVKK
jgi:rhodanese-related sulfurtransferase